MYFIFSKQTYLQYKFLVFLYVIKDSGSQYFPVPLSGCGIAIILQGLPMLFSTKIALSAQDTEKQSATEKQLKGIRQGSIGGTIECGQLGSERWGS